MRNWLAGARTRTTSRAIAACFKPDYRMSNATSSRAALPRSRLPCQCLLCSIVTLGVIGLFYLNDKHSMLEANPYYWFYPIGLLIGAGTIASPEIDDR